MRLSRISATATLAGGGLVVVGGLIHLRLARAAGALGIDFDSVLNDGGLVRTRLLSTRPAIATGTRAAAGTVLIDVNPELATFTAWATLSAIGPAIGTMVRLGLEALRRALAGTLSVTATTETTLTRALSGAGVLVKLAELFDSNSRDFMELLRAAWATLRMSLEALVSGAALEAAAHATTHTTTHTTGETALRPALRSAAEATLGSAVEALLKSLLDHLSTLGAEILPAAGTLLAELAAGFAQGLTFNLNSHLSRFAAITGAPLAAARVALHLAAAGSAQGPTFNLNSHLARFAAITGAPLAAPRVALHLAAAGSAQGPTLNLNSHLARPTAITGAPLAAARVALHLAAAGSAQGLTFNLNSHLARPAATVRVPLTAATLGSLIVVVQLDDVLALRLAGLGEGGGGQEA